MRQDGCDLGCMQAHDGPFVAFLEAGHDPTVTIYRDPVAVVVAKSLDTVQPAFNELAAHVAAGRRVAGFASYEAGAAFETAMPRRELRDMPYLWFGVFEGPESCRLGDAQSGHMPKPEPAYDEYTYRNLAERVRAYIGAGDTYQVNLTFPTHARLETAPLDLFIALARANPTAHYRSYIDTGEMQLLSVSPELFFELNGTRLTTRPMKGTIARGGSCDADALQRQHLLQSAKERAENLMIVDLLRNDMGRISRTGSVAVRSLFDTEAFDRVWQLTSTIVSETDAGVPDIFRALFPSGSVTGAPKIRTMEIIDEMETVPRGPYCGAIGWWGPERSARFSVGIRTAQVQRGNTLCYSVGSGITWDADPDAEYRECLLKASGVFSEDAPEPLFETIRLDAGNYALLDEHLARLKRSAGYFAIRYSEEALREAFEKTRIEYARGMHRVRLTLDVDGTFSIAVDALDPPKTFRVRWAESPVDPDCVRLFHKTMDRRIYAAAKEGFGDVDDVLLWNTRGDATESTIANLVVEIDGELLTPPVACGLLPGVFREALIARGQVRETVLTRDQVNRSDRIWLVNSLRGWIPAELADSEQVAANPPVSRAALAPSATLVS